jgi:hypothetical protein
MGYEETTITEPKKKLRVLIACEESQAVCLAFRELGHEAYSCDILDCSGGHPEWHIKGDVLEQLDKGWDMMIAFPPCTHLAVSGAAWFEKKRKDGRQQQGIDFFMAIVNAPINKIAVENPVGIMSKIYRKPDQVIQPYFFGDEFQKTTCLWLKNLPLLFHAKEPDLFNDVVTHVDKGEMHIGKRKDGSEYRMAKWYNDARSGDHGHKRSKTFPGIAKAMALQWGGKI